MITMIMMILITIVGNDDEDKNDVCDGIDDDDHAGDEQEIKPYRINDRWPSGTEMIDKILSPWLIDHAVIGQSIIHNCW